MVSYITSTSSIYFCTVHVLMVGNFSKFFSLLMTLPAFLFGDSFSSCEEGPKLGYLVFSSVPKILTSLTVAVVSVYVLSVMRRLNKV